jgi:excinuclease ABC subunit A
VSQVLVELVAKHFGQEPPHDDEEGEELERTVVTTEGGRVVSGAVAIKRLVRVEQKAIDRTPRSNLATYTSLFDDIRRLFAATKDARRHRYDAGRFSFNVANSTLLRIFSAFAPTRSLWLSPSVCGE